MRFLIDECLSPKLAELAWERDYEATHIARLGIEGTKDWDLVPLIEEGDWTFVTCNSVDFAAIRRAQAARANIPDCRFMLA